MPNLFDEIIEEAKKQGGTYHRVSCKEQGAIKEGVPLFVCRLMVDGMLVQFGIGTTEMDAQVDLLRKMKGR